MEERSGRRRGRRRYGERERAEKIERREKMREDRIEERETRKRRLIFLVTLFGQMRSPFGIERDHFAHMQKIFVAQTSAKERKELTLFFGGVFLHHGLDHHHL